MQISSQGSDLSQSVDGHSYNTILVGSDLL
jgi:hypothetical protein